MDDVSDLSDGGSEHGYRMSHLRETRNSFHDSGSPFIYNHASQHLSPGLREESQQPYLEKVPVKVKGWPLGAQPLRKYKGWGYFVLVIDVLVTFLPIIFLLIAGAALSLDGKPRSTFGDNINEATKYGTTAFPIVFAAIVARLLRAIALWRCEKGAKLGFLEQLMGSQSLAGTIERFFTLGRYDLTGIIILLLWILSPFGSQMTLRLLELGDSTTISNPQIQYFNTTSYNSDGSSFASASGLNTYMAALTSLMGANILSSQTVAKSVVDSWNNVKIPQLDEISSMDGGLNNSWIDVEANPDQAWVSISGIMTEGLPANGASTFLIESSYMAVSCPNSTRLPTKNLKHRLNSTGIVLNNHNTSVPWMENGQWNTMFLDTSNTTFPSAPTAPQSLIFGSIIGNNDEGGGVDSTPNIDIFDCMLTTPRIEVNITCDGTSCRAAQVRRSEKDLTSVFVPPFDMPSFINLLLFIPKSLGLPHDGDASPPDQYLLGSDAPFSLGTTLFSTGGYANISGPRFARRLTTLLNTAWQASICPYGIALGSAANLTACQLDPSFIPAATTNATVMKTIPNTIYLTNRWHALVLLLITLLLQVAAFVVLVLSAVTRAPNILGFVSSLTRDNPYVARVIPPGGSMLDGAERARILGDMRVQLLDVKVGDPVGRIAIAGVEESERGRTFGRLSKGRVYE